MCCPNQLYLIDSPVFILRKATGVDSKGSEWYCRVKAFDHMSCPHLGNSFIEKGGETTIQDELTGRAGLCHQIGSA